MPPQGSAVAFGTSCPADLSGVREAFGYNGDDVAWVRRLYCPDLHAATGDDVSPRIEYPELKHDLRRGQRDRASVS